MTISTTTAKSRYAGDGATTSFPTGFKFLDNDHVKVILRGADGSETLWSEGSEYALSGAGAPGGGTVAVSTSPTDYTPAAGETLVVKLAVPARQETSLPLGGAFPSTAVEGMADLAALRDQQVEEALSRALKFKETTALADMEFPEPEAGKPVAWNAAGDGLENRTRIGMWQGDWATATDYEALDIVRDPSTKNVYVSEVAHTSGVFATDLAASKWSLAINVADVEAAQAAAEAAQAGAETAETNAETAEANAAASASAAAGSASSAATQASNASGSASAAATSASNAATSETNAAGSASAAASSASGASSSASAAGTAQTAAETAQAAAETAQAAAETAETNAGTAVSDALAIYGSIAAVNTAVSDAQTAQTAAETAETNAETAEANAGSSASAAAGSASTAATQASAAASSAFAASTSESNANVYQGAALAYAGNAAASASAASSSASAASTAQTAAETAETNAETAETNAGAAQTAAQAAQVAAEAARDAALAAAPDWLSGSGAPAGGTGDVGDWYLDTASDGVYEKTGASTWTLRANIGGTDGADGADGAVWYNGTGDPAGGLGVVGDYYIDNNDGDYFEKTGASNWTARGNLVGPAGPGSGDMLKSENLSGLADNVAARANLGLGSIATEAAADYQATTDPYVGRTGLATERTGNFTFAATEADRVTPVNSVNAVAVEVPANSSMPLELGTMLCTVNRNSGVITWTPGAGVSLVKQADDTLSDKGQGSITFAIQIAADVWYVSGKLEAA